MSFAKVKFLDLGLADYKQVWDKQEYIFKNLIENKSTLNNSEKAIQTLIFCEHPHVYTLGKSGNEQNLLVNYIELQAKDATFVKTNRGGDITYHGPGQLVGYPILDLETYGIGIKEYIYNIEQAIILALSDYNIKGKRVKGAIGVWLSAKNNMPERKICAIGVKVTRFVSMHGFALNINTDLNYFKHINPCGFSNKAVSSMQTELNKIVDVDEVKQKVKIRLQEIFGFKLYN